MLSHNQAKHVQSLKHAKFRKLHGQFIAEGVKLAEELLAGDMEIQQVYALEGWLEKHEGALREKNIPFQPVREAELSRISQLTTPNEVLVLVKIPDVDRDVISTEDITLLLDRIQDPGNMGTILRTADWFGIKDIICSPGCADVYNPKVVQSTMGSITRVRVTEREPQAFLTKAGDRAAVYGAMMEGENIFHAKLKTPAIIVIGNESQGISGELIPLISHQIGIPGWSDKAESLNAAVAAGIVLAEFRRRLG
jgi:TrmH family RNA methyltransferase